MSVLQKIKELSGRRRKKKGSVTAYSEKMQKQPRYTARYVGAEVGKKSLKERLLRHRDQRTASRKGSVVKVVRNVLLAGIVVAAFAWMGQQILMGPLQGIFDDWEYFRIQKIEITGCRATSSAELKKLAGISYQLNMLTLDPADLKDRLLQHPWVASVSIQRVWPDGLVVRVKEHHPEALVVCGETNSFSYLNRKGQIFSAVMQGQALDFPVITGLDSIEGSSRKKEMLADVLLFLKLTKRNNPNLPVQNISEIHLTEEGGLIVYLVKHPFPIYFGRGKINNKYVQLWKVLEVLYQKRRGGSLIEKVAYIRMDYQDNKVLVARSSTG